MPPVSAALVITFVGFLVQALAFNSIIVASQSVHLFVHVFSSSQVLLHILLALPKILKDFVYNHVDSPVKIASTLTSVIIVIRGGAILL
ncbi:MAG: hypothetical protein JWQ96_3000 [Segetibacter sp.]|nr:hypothetical protein [Segetibacter sp.]